MRVSRVVPTLMAAGLLSCAQRVRPPEVPAADLAALETQQLKYQNDPDRLTAIGIAFYQARAYQRSRDVLLAVLALRPEAFRAAVQLGLTYEAMGQYDEALSAYHRAAAMKVSKRERELVEQRVVAVTRLLLAEEARRAIAMESTLASTPPAPNTIAVLPWSYLGTNSELKPLERGMAHLVLSDLAKISRFTLLERERVQALSDELALSDSGRIEPGTAARSGRLLRAAEVVQGSIRETGPDAIRLDANVVNASNAQIRAAAGASDKLTQLFSMEKSLVRSLMSRMGISLSPAEERAIAERPTADLQAFLAFSRGLEAEDRGRFSEAAQFFQQAAVRDPSFSMARDRAARTVQTEAAMRMTTARLAAAVQVGRAGGATTVRGAQLAAALQSIAPTVAGRLSQKSGKLVAVRARLAEALRQDDPSKLGTLGKFLPIIPRP